ncbi:glyoxalase/bleomycin resistance/extradiol dioxygenase family protein [Corynebacterium sp.]|uniref:VOC family protein n=1 Tax=Corynebacterium sp. TaxID=1720 RepID=UPI0026DBBA66|nr:VOC family protein [Corynebacterium sp.]MDO5076338.1 VOC family protein [Corynebacterium sp.]
MTTEPKTPANGKHTDNGRPRGFSSLTPFIALQDARTALSFYTEVFGARLVSSSELEGMIIHAELDFGCGRLQLGEGLEGYNLIPANPDQEITQFSLGIYVPDVDRVVEAAIARGAFLREPIAQFVSGDRFGSIRDPFGIRWSVMTRVEDLSDDESARRVAAWLAESSNQTPE